MKCYFRFIIHRFINYDLNQENDGKEARKEGEMPINLTPEYTYSTFNGFEKVEASSLLLSEQFKMEKMPGVDPDATQLDIDISSTYSYGSCSQNTNIKKRQLIIPNENMDEQ